MLGARIQNTYEKKHLTYYYGINAITFKRNGRIVFSCILDSDFCIPVAGKNGGWPDRKNPLTDRGFDSIM